MLRAFEETCCSGQVTFYKRDDGLVVESSVFDAIKRLGQVIAGGIQHRGCRTVLLLPSEHIEACGLRGIQPLAESIEDIGTELDRIGTAQLLNRETNLEGGRESVNRTNRRDCDLRRDAERPIDKNTAQALGIVKDLQRPCAARA